MEYIHALVKRMCRVISACVNFEDIRVSTRTCGFALGEGSAPCARVCQS